MNPTPFLSAFTLVLRSAAFVAITALVIPMMNPSAMAQNYPNRPVRMLVGVVPGGATDILARIFGQKLAESWRQQVVVDNRPGANQIIAADLTAKPAGIIWRV